MGDLIKLIETWAKFLGVDKSTFVVLTTTILLTIAFLYKFLPKWIQYFRNKKLEKDLHPFFDFYEIERSTEYFIKTRVQNIAPSREIEYSKNVSQIINAPLIPFFLKKGFKMGKDPDRFYMILADSGMGKTTFMINLFIQYKKQWWWKKDYQIKLMTLRHTKLDEELAAIDKKEQANTILLLDAFDEDQKAAQDYKKRLKEIIEKVQDFREVVITCRTQFFPDKDAIEGLEINVPRGLGGNYTLRVSYISPFSDKEIRRYLRKKFSIFHLKKRQTAFQIAKKVPYLMVRPMLLSKIDELLEDKQGYEYAGDIYQKMIDKWVDREAIKHKEDTTIYKEQLEKFTQAVALDIYQKRKERGGLLLSPEEIKAIADKEEIILEQIDLKSRSLLNRNAEGKYKFSHKSILEYLIAKTFAEKPQSIKITDFEGMDMLKFFLEEEIRKSFEKVDKALSKNKNYKRIKEHNTQFYKLKEKYLTQGQNILDFILKKESLSLNLSYNQISDISFLKDLKNLQSLYLSYNQISDISFLKDLKNLQSLYLRYNQISDYSFLKDLKNLQSLYLRYNQISDISFLKDLKNLQSLNLSANQISDISFLKDLKNLQRLNLSANQISDISFLKDLKNLQRLNLSANQISDISFLKDLKNLQRLNLSANQISDISFVKDLKNLQRLNLSANQISDISFVKDLKNLQSLYLRYNQISDISFLKDLKNLQSLNLSANQISDISFVKDLKQLQRLYLSYNQISDISFVKDLKNLQSLNLSYNQISEEQRNDLKKALPNCRIYF